MVADLRGYVVARSAAASPSVHRTWLRADGSGKATRLLQEVLKYDVDGVITLNFATTGLLCTIYVPICIPDQEHIARHETHKGKPSDLREKHLEHDAVPINRQRRFAGEFVRQSFLNHHAAEAATLGEPSFCARSIPVVRAIGCGGFARQSFRRLRLRVAPGSALG